MLVTEKSTKVLFNHMVNDIYYFDVFEGLRAHVDEGKSREDARPITIYKNEKWNAKQYIELMKLIGKDIGFTVHRGYLINFTQVYRVNLEYIPNKDSRKNTSKIDLVLKSGTWLGWHYTTLAEGQSHMGMIKELIDNASIVEKDIVLSDYVALIEDKK